MSLDTLDQVNQFIKLQQKTDVELQEICKNMNLETTGSKLDLITRLIDLINNQTEQELFFAPQAIPLSTKDSQGKTIPEAIEMFKKWRKMIYEAKGNIREFYLVNSLGKQYKNRLKYIPCDEQMLGTILEHKWYFMYEGQITLINSLQANPDRYKTSIIQKPDNKGNNWLMLHCQQKPQTKEAQ